MLLERVHATQGDQCCPPAPGVLVTQPVSDYLLRHLVKKPVHSFAQAPRSLAVNNPYLQNFLLSALQKIFPQQRAYLTGTKSVQIYLRCNPVINRFVLVILASHHAP